MPESASQLRFIQAVNAGLRWGLETYPEFLIFGEDVALPGGPFGATKGLHDLYPDRVFDTPISEAGFVGAALGAAMRGLRPLVEIMRSGDEQRAGLLRPSEKSSAADTL